MPLRVNNNILNQKGTPAFFSDTFANRPAFGFAGRVFISTDTGQIYEDTGTAWTLIADAGVGGGTLASVCANGNTTATGMTITAGNLGIGTATAGAPLDIHGTGTIAQFNGTGTNNAYVFFQNAGTSKWRLGNNYNAGANSFDLYNNTLASVALSVNNPYNVLQLNANLAIKQSTGIFTIAGYNAIACDSGGFFFNCSTANTAYFNFIGLTGSRSYTFPDTNGTLALTSQLPSISGTTNYVSKFTAATTLGDSLIYDNGTSVGIGIVPSTWSGGSIFGTQIKKASIYEYGGYETGLSVNANYNSGWKYIGSNTATQIKLSDGTISFLNASAGTAGNAISFSERMQINASGQVLIGSTSSLYPNAKLSVKQTAANLTAEIWSNYATDFGNPALTIIKNDNNTTTSQCFQRFAIDNGNAASGQINANGASQAAFGTWSDIRLKENIVNLPNQLQNILALRTVEFDYKNGKGHNIGFIAQEIQNIYPDSVNEDINGYLMVTGWNKTEAILVKAIQELHEKLVRNNIN